MLRKFIFCWLVTVSFFGNCSNGIIAILNDKNLNFEEKEQKTLDFILEKEKRKFGFNNFLHPQNGVTPLNSALVSGFFRAALCLLNLDCNPAYLDSGGRNAIGALLIGKRLDTKQRVALLKQSLKQVDNKGKKNILHPNNQEVALNIALLKGFFQEANLLLSYKYLDISQLDTHGNNALLAALFSKKLSKESRLEFVKKIIKRARKDGTLKMILTQREGKFPANIAVSKGYFDIAKYLLELKKGEVSFDEECLINTIVSNELSSSQKAVIVELLIEKYQQEKFDINEIVYPKQDSFPLNLAIYRKLNKVIKALLNFGVNPQFKDNNNHNAFYYSKNLLGNVEIRKITTKEQWQQNFKFMEMKWQCIVDGNRVIGSIKDSKHNTLNHRQKHFDTDLEKNWSSLIACVRYSKYNWCSDC